jgi:hypothetical protein
MEGRSKEKKKNEATRTDLAVGSHVCLKSEEFGNAELGQDLEAELLAGWNAYKSD